MPFPIIADRNGSIARKYGMIASNISNTETVRNVYIIDTKGVIRLILVYPMNIGRCIPEILRAIDALQTADCNKASTPANWVKGEPIIIPPPKTINELYEREKSLKENKNGIGWYLSYKIAENDCTEIKKNEIKQEKCK